ncbi:MAG: divergent PAP2 family protein [Anaerolineales bacterium]|nr:MAG: divergent PAP2 family protein [Anaerolineales bacterium]
MNLGQIFSNHVLISALIAWSLAQVLKMPVHYLRTKERDWSLLLRAGGMPSSHTALVSGIAHGIGLSLGFDSPLFALAVAFAMIVTYDATGIRRQAGRHAIIINAMINDFLEGDPEHATEKLREVLGHSPAEAIAGLIMGIGLTQAYFNVFV